jgi:hypothetical protein
MENDDTHNLHISSKIIRVIKSRYEVDMQHAWGDGK